MITFVLLGIHPGFFQTNLLELFWYACEAVVDIC